MAVSIRMPFYFNRSACEHFRYFIAFNVIYIYTYINREPMCVCVCVDIDIFHL